MAEKPFIYLAPLEGVTEIDYRNIYAKYFEGVDAAIAPFVTLNRHDINEKIRGWNIPSTEHQKMITIPQFMGRNLNDFDHLAKWVKHKGYDEINWNLGCPVKRVVRKGRGCGQLKHPDEIRQFLDVILPKYDLKFSIKTRLGLSDPDECFKLIELYNDYPLSEIILHPRIGAQLYSGEVKLDYFEECLKISKNELVYNGDIRTIEDFENIRKRFPSVKKFMLGRGLLRDPFLAEKIKGLTDPNAEFDKARFSAFHHDLFTTLETKFWNKKELLGKMKEYWLSFSYLFEDRNTVSKYIVRSQDLAEFNARVLETIG
jgi:tRNA-dihydrouridine synthase B